MKKECNFSKGEGAKFYRPEAEPKSCGRSTPTSSPSWTPTRLFAWQLEKLYPDDRHVLDKIRQQLQVLRDLGFVQFLGHGCYRSL
jgi:hypothetical protein